MLCGLHLLLTCTYASHTPPPVQSAGCISAATCARCTGASAHKAAASSATACRPGHTGGSRWLAGARDRCSNRQEGNGVGQSNSRLCMPAMAQISSSPVQAPAGAAHVPLALQAAVIEPLKPGEQLPVQVLFASAPLQLVGHSAPVLGAGSPGHVTGAACAGSKSTHQWVHTINMLLWHSNVSYIGLTWQGDARGRHS